MGEKVPVTPAHQQYLYLIFTLLREKYRNWWYFKRAYYPLNIYVTGDDTGTGIRLACVHGKRCLNDDSCACQPGFEGMDCSRSKEKTIKILPFPLIFKLDSIRYRHFSASICTWLLTISIKPQLLWQKIFIVLIRPWNILCEIIPQQKNDCRLLQYLRNIQALINQKCLRIW